MCAATEWSCVFSQRREWMKRCSPKTASSIIIFQTIQIVLLFFIAITSLQKKYFSVHLYAFSFFRYGHFTTTLSIPQTISVSWNFYNKNANWFFLCAQPRECFVDWGLTTLKYKASFHSSAPFRSSPSSTTVRWMSKRAPHATRASTAKGGRSPSPRQRTYAKLLFPLFPFSTITTITRYLAAFRRWNCVIFMAKW